jgi:hypothetical protein
MLMIAAMLGSGVLAYRVIKPRHCCTRPATDHLGSPADHSGYGNRR